MKVRVNLHGIMTVSSASLIESKESAEQEQMEEQATPPEQNGAEQPAEGSNGAPPEVGPSWSKRISAWFGRVRIDPRAGLACLNYDFCRTFFPILVRLEYVVLNCIFYFLLFCCPCYVLHFLLAKSLCSLFSYQIFLKILFNGVKNVNQEI